MIKRIFANHDVNKTSPRNKQASKQASKQAYYFPRAGTDSAGIAKRSAPFLYAVFPRLMGGGGSPTSFFMSVLIC